MYRFLRIAISIKERQRLLETSKFGGKKIKSDRVAARKFSKSINKTATLITTALGIFVTLITN